MKLTLILLVFSSLVLGQDVSDFAPLKIGNQWKFIGNYLGGSDAGVRITYDLNRSISILSVSMKSDTSIYSGIYKDSIFNHHRNSEKRPDEYSQNNFYVELWPNGTIFPRFENSINNMVYEMFSFKSYPVNQLAIERVNGVEVYTLNVSSVSPYPCGGANLKIKKIQNIGLSSYSSQYISGSCFEGHTISYNLIRFNSENLTPIYKIGRPKRFIELNLNFNHTNYDLNGRELKIIQTNGLTTRSNR